MNTLFFFKKKGSWFGIVTTVLVGLILIFILLEPKRTSSKQTITEAVEIYKSRCPKMVNETTRLDSVSYKDKEIIFSYTLLENAEKNDSANFVSNIKPKFLEYLKALPNLNIYKENVDAFKLSYNDANGTGLFNIMIENKEF